MSLTLEMICSSAKHLWKSLTVICNQRSFASLSCNRICICPAVLTTCCITKKSIHVSAHCYTSDRLTCLRAWQQQNWQRSDPSRSPRAQSVCWSGFIQIWTSSVTLQALSLLPGFCWLCSVSPKIREGPQTLTMHNGCKEVIGLMAPRQSLQCIGERRTCFLCGCERQLCFTSKA